jgi:hypothetical protein
MAATFKRIKIQATVETAGMLVGEDQIAAAVAALKEKLTALDLAVLTIEAQDQPPVEFPESLEKELD